MAKSATGNKAGTSKAGRRYDKDLVRELTLELLSVRLGPPKNQGARLVWDCPACGKHEKYSIKKADGKGGCLVADCRLAGYGDIFVMLAGLEDLDYQADFLTVLARSYELLGLESTGVSRAQKGDVPKSASRNSGPKGATVPESSSQKKAPRDRPGKSQASTIPVSVGGVRSSSGPVQGAANGSNTATLQDLEVLLALAARVYERILALCPLESRDRSYLRERGLSYDTIWKGRFGTMTAPRARKVKAELQREFGREELLRVPGFSYDEAEGRLKFTFTGNYMLIPYHDRDGNITTIEGRVVGEVPSGMGKYVSLRRAGNHLYLFPGHRPEELLAVCEGAMGAIVAAESGLAVGAIMGCERFRASLSAEMLDGGSEDPLLELKGADFGGRTVPYIPDADDPPNPNVLRAAPKAARWIAEPQNGKAAICLLPEGADLDEWLLTLDPKERGVRFDELLCGANPPEDVGSASLPKSTPEPALDHHDSSRGESRILTAEDLAKSNAKRPNKTASKRKSQAAPRLKAEDKSERKGEMPQPGLWEDDSSNGSDGAASGTDQEESAAGAKSTRREVSAGARKVRDEVYRAVIGALPPKEKHLQALEKKGVMREVAHYGRFASLDSKDAKKMAQELAERFGAKKLHSVPGFELDGTGKIRLSMASGGTVSGEYLLLPCFDAKGFLVGLEGLAYDPKGGEIEAEETVPLSGAGSHLYVFAAYESRQLEGFCEGVLGALLAAQDDVVIGAIGGFRRYKAASGPGEGGQPVDAVLPELEGVNFGERQIAYAPRAGVSLGEQNARYHEATPAARRLIERQNGRPAVVDLGDGEGSDDETVPTSLGGWILSLPDERSKEHLRELFPESPASKDGARETDDYREIQETPKASGSHGPGERRDDHASRSLPPALTYGMVALASLVGAALDLTILRLRDFAVYVDVQPGGDPILYAGALGILRRLADAAPFHVLYGAHWLVAFAAALLLVFAVLSKAGKSHQANLSAECMRLEERWNLHLTPVRVPPAVLLTPGEVVWPVLTWPIAYLVSGWVISGTQGLLSLAASLELAPDVGTLVADPAQASLYTATALSAFVFWQRRSIRAAEGRMLRGEIRH